MVGKAVECFTWQRLPQYDNEIQMNEETAPEKDPFLSVEKLLANAREQTARQVERWQSAHQTTDDSYRLVRQFNEERKQIGASDEFNNQYTMFANVSGVTLWNLATDLQKPEDPTITAGTSSILLSSLQSNVASFVSSIDFDVKEPFIKTLGVLKAQDVPLETRIATLSRRIGKFSDHLLQMLRGVEKDLLNQTNPVSISNAAKNLRETLTAFIHDVAPDGRIERWPDCKVDDKTRPTRRSRLEFHAFLAVPKKNWPKKWAEQVENRVSSVLHCFEDLNKFTHVNEGTADELGTARINLDKFVIEFLVYLDTADEANEVLDSLLREGVEQELQRLVDGDLESWLEEGATHAYPDDVYCDQLRIDEKNGDRIAFSGRCCVCATFQIGSNSDVRSGDGAEWKGKKFFTFSGTASTANFNDVAISRVASD
jgi:hypothetical protein